MQELVDEWQKSIRALAIECSILAILRDHDMSDAELTHEFKDRTKNVEMFIGVDPCRSLHTMERRGLIAAGGMDRKSKLEPGKQYHITGKGEKWLNELVSSSSTCRSQPLA
jgi:DNA-binding PadR family transcriptional regulator